MTTNGLPPHDAHADAPTPAKPGRGGRREGAGRTLGAIDRPESKDDITQIDVVKSRLGEISEEFANATPLEILEKGMRIFASAGRWAEAVAAAEKAAKYRHPTMGSKNHASVDASGISDAQLTLISDETIPLRRKAA